MTNQKFTDYINPVIQALRELGGSARAEEVYKYVAAMLQLPPEILEEEKESGGSRYENQVAWARFYLAKSGHIGSSKRGVWALTDKGNNTSMLSEDDIQKLIKSVQAASLTKKDTGGVRDFVPPRREDSIEEAIEKTEKEAPICSDYRSELLQLLKALPPSGFERLCQRLLRESGFQEVTVTGRSGDGGIDGIGILQVNPFVTFKVLFQCKRYDGSVGPSQVRDFRGAMMGRTDKGIIITTGTFTSDARKEAVRDGVPPIELVDGEDLINLFEQIELGLVPRKTFEVDTRFFHEYM